MQHCSTYVRSSTRSPWHSKRLLARLFYSDVPAQPTRHPRGRSSVRKIPCHCQSREVVCNHRLQRSFLSSEAKLKLLERIFLPLQSCWHNWSSTMKGPGMHHCFATKSYHFFRNGVLQILKVEHLAMLAAGGSLRFEPAVVLFGTCGSNAAYDVQPLHGLWMVPLRIALVSLSRQTFLQALGKLLELPLPKKILLCGCTQYFEQCSTLRS